MVPITDRSLHLTTNDVVSSPAPDAVDHPTIGATPRLASEDLEELRAAIERSLCEEEERRSADGRIDEDLRKSLRVACAKARLQRVRAEHLVIDLKQIWMTTPTMLSSRTDAKLSEIVFACIDEYYEKDNRHSF